MTKTCHAYQATDHTKDATPVLRVAALAAPFARHRQSLPLPPVEDQLSGDGPSQDRPHSFTPISLGAGTLRAVTLNLTAARVSSLDPQDGLQGISVTPTDTCAKNT